MLLGPLAWAHYIEARCTETADVTVLTPWGWEMYSITSSEARLRFSPREWGFVLALTVVGESTSTWTAANEAALSLELTNYFADRNLDIVILSFVDLNNDLVVTVVVSGFLYQSQAQTSYNGIAKIFTSN